MTRASSRFHLSATVDAPQSVPIRDAVAILRRGGLVAFPTETVYGLGADASNPEAVAKIFDLKGRPRNHPLIVHLADAEVLLRGLATAGMDHDDHVAALGGGVVGDVAGFCAASSGTLPSTGSMSQ